MNRSVCLSCLAILTIAAGWALTGPTAEVPPQKMNLGAFSTKTFEITFEANKVARAICIGDGSTYMGLYIYDLHGNCVASESNQNASKVRDDLIVEWVPGEKTRYTIEVVNLGRVVNRFTLAVK